MEVPHQAYDAFFKYSLPGVADTLISLLENKAVVSIRSLSTQLSHVVLKHELDFAYEVEFDTGQKATVQIEEETGSDANLAEKLLGQLSAAKKAFNQYPRQYVGFLPRKAHLYRNGLEVKDDEGFVVARLYIHAFNFLDLPSEPFIDSESPMGLAVGLFCDLSRIPGDRIIEQAKKLAPVCSMEEKNQIVAGAMLAFKKSFITRELLDAMIKQILGVEGPTKEATREYALDLAYNTPVIGEFVLEDIERRLRERDKFHEAEKRAAEEKLIAEKRAAEEKLIAEKITTARKLLAAGANEEFIFNITGLKPGDY